ncbi:MAG TPA: alpha/beta fold hydrolase [Terriglobales bacterium]|nr:alpha/beta fold hydrolase [Terriglobales bacterium]
MVGTTQSPETTTTFVPRRWLRGGHVQTIASFLLPRRFNLPAPEDRLIEVAPRVQVLCQCHWQTDRTKPLTIILVHGLEGSSDSQYVRGITEKALTLGMNVIRYNQRNCGGTDALAPVLYHSGLSSDIEAVARHIIERDGVSHLAFAGFSMGGNLVLKLAGEWGTQGPPQFHAVAACCPAMDLAASADALHDPVNRLYERYFLFNLGRRMKRKAQLFPDHFDVSRLQNLRSLREFDDKITAYYCGFKGADDYYARASASNVVEKIAVPALVVHAANDPFVRILAETRRKIASNPNLRFIEADDGGHCAFLGAPDGMDDGFWAENQIISFLRGF